jgi:putative MATE family efflux protein
MLKSEKSLTVWTIAIPFFLELVAVSSINIMDVFFMSLISDKAVAALGAICQIIIVLTILVRALTGGGGSIAAQHLGAKNQPQAVFTFMFTVALAAVCGLIFSLFLFLARHHICALIGLQGETSAIAVIYLSVVGPGFFLLAVRTGYTTITSVIDQAKWNLISALISNVVNISLNFIFVFGLLGAPKLGVFGIALATSISYAVYLALIVAIVHTHLNVRFLFPADLVLRLLRMTWPVMRIAVPNSIDSLSYSLFMAAVTVIIIQLGDETLAAHTYVQQVMVFVALWSYSISQGQSIWTAHLVGAKEFDKAEREVKKSIVRGLLVALPAVMALYLFSGHIFGLFTDNTFILNTATTAVLAYFGIEVGRAFNATLSFSLASSGDAKYPAILAIIFNWFLGVPIAILFAIVFDWGLLGALFGIALDELARSPLNLLRWNSRKWTTKGVAASQFDNISMIDR